MTSTVLESGHLIYLIFREGQYKVISVENRTNVTKVEAELEFCFQRDGDDAVKYCLECKCNRSVQPSSSK